MSASMPSPRDRPQDRPGICWPVCASQKSALVLDARDRSPKAAGEVQEGVRELREDLAGIHKQLSRVLDGQAELQASVLKALLEPPAAFANWHHHSGGNESPHGLRAKGRLSPAASPGAPGRKASGEQEKSIYESSRDLKKDALQRLFDLAEEHEHEMAQRKERRRRSCLHKVSELFAKKNLEMTVDTIMAVVIALNALFIGLSSDMDTDGHVGWMVVDGMFSVLFIFELGTKIGIHGWRQHFFGPFAFSNCFDACLIITDLIQLIIQITIPGISLDDAPPASIFRTVRLIKIARVLRLVNIDVFKDLIQMIQGMLGGISTLMWSMVFFGLILYVAALLFRELLGRRKEAKNVTPWFNSVPRSMYSTFRCSFGDCANIAGQPIFEFVQEEMGEYSWFFSLIYCLFIFSITIGLFNVISAIFVESTMAAAQKMAQEKKRKRHADEHLLASRVTRLITCILKHSEHGGLHHKFTESVDELFEIEVARSVIDEAIQDPVAKEILDDLDISPQDRTRLSDIFDPDNGGTISLAHVAAGIRRLRGEPRRSDIVCVDLMIRSMQVQMSDVLAQVEVLMKRR